jgi:uncharacterized membrane protein (DUF106 family)
MDTSRVFIEVLPSGGIDQAVVTTTRDQMEVLKEKYSKFKKKKNEENKE